MAVDQITALLLLYYGYEIAAKQKEKQRKKKQRAKKRFWVRPYLQRRLDMGHYSNLMQELARETPQLYQNFTRLTQDMFDAIVQKITPDLEKNKTWIRIPWRWV